MENRNPGEHMHPALRTDLKAGLLPEGDLVYILDAIRDMEPVQAHMSSDVMDEAYFEAVEKFDDEYFDYWKEPD